jgi:hypothetical protein
VEYDLGFPRRRVIPDFRVLVVAPGKRGDVWTYVTVGCWAAAVDGVEFAMTSSRRDDSVIAALASAAWRYASRGGAGDHPLVAEFDVPGGRCRLVRLDHEVDQPGRADDRA